MIFQLFNIFAFATILERTDDSACEDPKNCALGPCLTERCRALCAATGCDSDQLANSTCDAQCSRCLQGCGWCAQGCEEYTGFEHMLSNGVCDSECEVEACGYDADDCASEEAQCLQDKPGSICRPRSKVSSRLLSQCPAGQFWDGTECSVCNSSCSSCLVSPTNCADCAVAFFPTDSLPGQCTKDCHASCLACVGVATRCALCAEGFMPLAQLPGLCVEKCSENCVQCFPTAAQCNECEQGYFFATSGLCVPQCDVSCQSCELYANNCLSCSEGFQPYSTLPGICADAHSCHESCIDCSGAFTACSECADGFLKSQSQCLYPTCHSSCATCSGPTYSDCLSCSTDADYLPVLKMCLFKVCGGACATCFGPFPDQCLTCTQHSQLISGTNYCACNTLYEFDTSAKACVYSGKCHETCSSCSGPFASDCVSCPAKASLRESECHCETEYSWEGGRCVYEGTCPAECASCSSPTECLTCHSRAVLAGSTCVCEANYSGSTCEYAGPCSEQCATCSGPGTEECLSCIDSVNSHGSACQCSENFEWDSATLSCIYTGICAEAYAQCSGPTHAEGLKCDNNASKVGTSCTCNSGYTWDPSLGLCVTSECHATCVTCIGRGAKDCASCLTANSQVLVDGSCECATGWSISSKTDQCSACDPTCKTCSGKRATNCKTCYDHATLAHDNSCMCDEGFYRDGASCLPCSAPCVTCSALHQCLSCPQYFALSGSTCGCAENAYLAGSDCLPCHSTCKSCSGSTDSQCTACESEMTLRSGRCECTQPGQFNHGGNCLNCPEGCLACTDLDTCTACFEDAALFAGACACISPMHPAPTPKECGPCASSCADCRVPGEDSCTVCRANAEPAGGSFPSACVCLAGFYLSAQQCAPCHASCRSCHSSSPFFCDSCLGLSLGLYCEQYCPSNFVVLADSCSPTTPLIFSLSFSGKNAGIDAVGSYKVIRDAAVFYRQGLQLSSQQYAQLPPNSSDRRSLTLSSTHYAELWVRQASPGVLLSKSIGATQLLSLSTVAGRLKVALRLYSLTIPLGLRVGSLYGEVAVPGELDGGEVGEGWTRVGYSVSLSQRTTTLKLFVGTEEVASRVVLDAFFRDFRSASEQFLLGSAHNDSFEGQIAELSLYNDQSAPSSTQPCIGCSLCTEKGMCLSPCSKTQFESAQAICSACPSDCPGCMRATDCIQNVDPLCEVSDDFIGCTICKRFAELVDGVCQCVSTATYSDASCSPSCRNYFFASEVSAEFNSALTAVVVSFARAVADPVASCSDVFVPATLEKLGNDPSCFFDSSRQHLTVALGTGATLVQEELVLKQVTASQGECAAVDEPLRPVAMMKYELPKPIAKITVQSQLSTVCESVLAISGRGSSGAAGRPLHYKWTFSPTITDEYSVFSETQPAVSIPSSLLSGDRLSVTLTVKNAFGVEDSQSEEVKIQTSAALSLDIEGGRTATITRNQGQVFKARVLAACGDASAFTFAWTLESDGAIEIASTKRTLMLLPNSLQVGKYEFKVVAGANKVTGEDRLTVTVLPGPLSVHCNRGDGDHSASRDLIIDCSQSKDTDQPDAADLKATWTCVQAGGKCINAVGGQLLLGTTLVLSVPSSKLAIGAVYTFTLQVSKDSRADSFTLSISIVTATALDCKIKTERLKYSARESIRVEADVNAPTGAVFQWRQTGGPPASARNTHIPYLDLAPLPPGQVYSFTLTVSNGSASVSASISIRTSAAPRLGSFTVSPQAGQALLTPFKLTHSGWQDDDGDYPLTAQFGFLQQGEFTALSVPATAPELSTQLFAGQVTLAASICDSLGTCTEVRASVDVSRPGRALESSALMTLFQQSTLDSDKVPGSCTVFAKSVALDQSLWNFINSRILEYSSEYDVVGEDQLGAELGCLQALADVPERQSAANFRTLLATARVVLGRFNQAFTSKIFSDFMNIFRKFSLSSEREIEDLEDYALELISSYLPAFLPYDDPVARSGESMCVYFARRTADSLALEISSPELNFTASTPTSLRGDLGLDSAAVVDIRITQSAQEDMPAGILNLILYKVGTYRLKFIPEPETLITCEALSQPINITLPLRAAGGDSYQCVSTCRGEWRAAGCEVASLTNTSVTIKATCLGQFTVVSKEVVTFHAAAIPEFTTEDVDCEQTFVPVFIMVAVAVSGLVLLAASLALENYRRNAKKVVKPDQSLHMSRISQMHLAIDVLEGPPGGNMRDKHNLPRPHVEQPISTSTIQILMSENPWRAEPAVRQNSAEHAIPGDLDDDRPEPDPSPAESGDKSPAFAWARMQASQSPVRKHHSFLEGHHLIGIFLAKRRWEKLLSAVTVLLSEHLFLGAFYYSQFSKKRAISSALWREHEGQDILFCLYSVLLGAVVSVVLTTVWTLGVRRPAKERALWVGSGVGVCAVVIILSTVLVSVFSVRMCGEDLGKWSVSFLWCALAEVFALQFFVAGVRFLLLRILQTKS